MSRAVPGNPRNEVRLPGRRASGRLSAPALPVPSPPGSGGGRRDRQLSPAELSARQTWDWSLDRAERLDRIEAAADRERARAWSRFYAIHPGRVL